MNAVMAQYYTKDDPPVHGEGIVHGDLTAVRLILIYIW